MKQVLEFIDVELVTWDVTDDLEAVTLACEEFKAALVGVLGEWFPGIELLACVLKFTN